MYNKVLQLSLTLGWYINRMFRENIEWYKSEGASEFEIAKLINLVGFELPHSYIESLRFSNGGEDSLSVQPLRDIQMLNWSRTIEVWSNAKR